MITTTERLVVFLQLTRYMSILAFAVHFYTFVFSKVLYSIFREIRDSKKWGKCMEVAVVMIDRKENNSVKRERWRSLPRCNFFSSPILFSMAFWVGGRGYWSLMHFGWFHFNLITGLMPTSSSRRVRNLEPCQSPILWKVLLHLQIRIRGRLWSLDFLQKEAHPRYLVALILVSITDITSRLTWKSNFLANFLLHGGKKGKMMIEFWKCCDATMITI